MYEVFKEHRDCTGLRFVSDRVIRIASYDMAQWLSWLERRPVTAEVTGSSPVWVA